MQIKLIHLFPELLNLSGDRGNITVLEKRCRLRGISLEVVPLPFEDAVSLRDADLVYLGNGSEKDYPRIVAKLKEAEPELLAFRERDGVLLAVGNSYPMLGTTFPVLSEEQPGIHLMDIKTIPSDIRMTGNASVNTPFGVLVGFENHTGITRLGASVTPLGTVLSGFGNNSDDRTEGAMFKNIFGTYLTGPLLPNNPEFADLLIDKAIRQKYNHFEGLSPLSSELENLAKGYLLNYDHRTHKR